MHGIIPSPFDESQVDGDSRYLSPEQFNAIGKEAQIQLDLLAGAMQDILHAISVGIKKRPAFKSAAIRLTADGLKISKDRLAHLFYDWEKKGERALVNHNKCGGKCGFPECNVKRKSAINDAIRDEWIKLAADSDKNSMVNAHKVLIAKLASGETIIGVGTWHDLYASLYPTKRAPQHCPWSIHTPPPGWSVKNFLAKKPTKAEYLLAKKGLAACEAELRKHLPVNTDTKDLRPLELSAIDDHRLDFQIVVGTQIVEVEGLFHFDVGMRKVLAFGLRPCLVRPDGTSEGLTKRDTQHVIGDTLRQFGFPKNWIWTIRVENAAAAVTTECKAMTSRVTKGKVVIVSGPVGNGTSRPDGYKELYGKPEWKPWLESFFNLLDIELGYVKGQMGSTYARKPGDFDARQRAARKLANRGLMELLPESVQSFHTLDEAYAMVREALHRIHTRGDHDMEGFRDVLEWRFGEHDQEWKTIEDPLFKQLPREQQNALLNDKRTGHPRKESPAEKWERLHRVSDFQRISPEVMFDFFIDMAKATYRGHNVLAVEVRTGLKLTFYGEDHKMALGQKVTARFDLNQPTHVWIQDEAGRGIGVMEARIGAKPGDKLQQSKLHGQRMKVLGGMLARVRMTHTDPDKIADIDRAIAVISAETGLLPLSEEAPADNQSLELLKAIRETGEDDGNGGEDLYMKLHGIAADDA